MYVIKRLGDLEDVRCRKKTENLNPRIFETKNGRMIIQSKCANCRTKK